MSFSALSFVSHMAHHITSYQYRFQIVESHILFFPYLKSKLYNFNTPLTFIFTSFQTTFDAPAGTAPFALDMGSMGKGQVWLVPCHFVFTYWHVLSIILNHVK